LELTEIAALYKSADIALNTSLIDNMPNSVLESLASGVPVVSTNVGGVPYIVQDGKTALLVPPGDAQAMSEAVATLLHDESLAQSLIQNGLASVQRYSWANVRDAWLAAYSEQTSVDQRSSAGVKG
jgi:glycosyltransferase involved in cell wall biosynthesis